MKTFITLLFLVAMASSTFAQEEFELPTDKNTAVLTFDYSGGFRMRPPEGFVKKPQLQIFPDGRVLRSPNGPNLPSSEFTITQDQLQAFLESVVTENSFYEVDPEAIQAAIKKTGQQIMIADAPNVDISVYLGQGRHEVSIYAVTHTARQFPDIKSLAHMAAIEKLCRRMISVADLGGFEQLESAIAKVNEKLAADHPEIPQMTEDQLRFASKTNDENVSASFNSKVETDGNASAVRANYVRKADGSEEVTVNIYPIRKR